MKTKEIIKLIERRYVVSIDDIIRFIGGERDNIIKILNYMIKKGDIIRIRRGLYTKREFLSSVYTLATAIKRPSYISLAYALAMQGVITQYITEIEVVTTAEFPKSMSMIDISGFKVRLYRIKPELMFGYRWEEEKPGFHYAIAYPEKAFLDLLYFGIDPEEIFTVSWEMININRLMEYSRYYNRKIRSQVDAIVNRLQRVEMR